jgi:hypothetical protein
MNVLIIAMIVLIVIALGFVATGALNLYSENPRGHGVRLGLIAVALVLIGVVYEEVGIALAAFLFVVLVVGQLLWALNRRGPA